MSVRRAQDERLEGTPDGLNAVTEISDVPDAPTIGAVSDSGDGTTATVAYTAAVTGGTVTTFTATSTPGSFTGTGSSPISVTGLTAGTAYTFTVKGTNSTGTGPDSSASSSLTLASPGVYESINSIVISNTTTRTVTFGSIPQTYKHLQLRIVGRSRRAVELESGAIWYNGDENQNNYYCHFVQTNNGSTVAASYTPQDYITMLLTGSTAAANQFSATICDIFDYTSSNYKVHKSFSSVDLNGGSTYLRYSTELWLNTSAITSVSLNDGGGGANWEVGSVIALYGLKG